MKKVAIIGPMSNGKGSLNGQTVKVKVLVDELCHEYGAEHLLLISTSGNILKILVFIRIIVALLCCSNIIILPAKNGLRLIVPYLSFLNRIFNRSLHYDVIGGWLPNYIESRTRLKECLKGFLAIYVETNKMKQALNAQGFNNIIVLPNCKKLTIIDDSQICIYRHEKIIFATFSRVMKSKGIEDAVVAIRKANINRGLDIFHLDVYGFIEKGETEWFENLQNEFQLEMTYKGEIPFKQSTDVLKQYYGLLFPTYYHGEGLAGSLIDAFAAGLPVIASDWKYNTEIVFDGNDGLIVPIRDTDKLADAILWSQEHAIEWLQFKKNVIRKAHNYLPSKVLGILKKNLK